MATPTRTLPSTEGELLFQDYLKAMQYPYEFEKEFPGKLKKPDYTVTHNGGEFLFDVKDFDPYAPLGGGAYDPYPRIREKVDEGRDKFKQFKEYPCSLVLRNRGNALVDLESPDIMLGTMYGDSGFTVPIYVGGGPVPKPSELPEAERAFLGRGKMFRYGDTQNAHNTTISALITLRHVGVGMRQYRVMIKKYPNLDIEETLAAAAKEFPNFDLGERQLGVIVWENAVARIPLSRDLFTGPYDERWGCEDGHQSIVFTGDKLAELAK